MKMMGRRSLASFVTVVVNIGCFILLALVGLSVCLLATTPFLEYPRVEVGLLLPTAFTVEPQTHTVTQSPSYLANVHLDGLQGSVAFTPRTKGVVAGAALLLIATLSLVLWVLMQLRAVLRTLQAGQPFVAANATRIRRIAYAIVFGELVRAALVFAGMGYVLSNFSLQGVQFKATLEVNLVVIVCGLIVLVIAEVFREGTRLNEEQSLTV